jgi:hypothetical protein
MDAKHLLAYSQTYNFKKQLIFSDILSQQQKVTNTRNGVIAVTMLDYVIQKFLVCVRNLEGFVMPDREALGCCKQNLVDNSGGIPEDQNADRNVGSKDCALHVSTGN